MRFDDVTLAIIDLDYPMITRRAFLASVAVTIVSSRAGTAGESSADEGGTRAAQRVRRVFAAGPPAAVLVYVLAPDALIGWPSRLDDESLALLGKPAVESPGARTTGRPRQHGLARDARAAQAGPGPGRRGCQPHVHRAWPTAFARKPAFAMNCWPAAWMTVPGSCDRPAPCSASAIVGPDWRKRQSASLPASLAGERVAAARRVYFARGADGLETGLRGSINMEVVEFVGAQNVAASAGTGGITRVSLEQVLAWDPHVILTQDRTFAKAVLSDPLWQSVTAVRTRRVLVAPVVPFGWLDGPPGINRLIGARWLAAQLDGDPVERPPNRPARLLRSVLRNPPVRGAARSPAGRPVVTEPARSARWRTRTTTALAALVLAGMVLLALALGKYAISPDDVVRVIVGRVTGHDFGVPQAIITVVWNIRLPRVAAGLLVGAALAAAGAAYQAMFRDPLVSPDILGVSAGAGFGALLGIFLRWPVAAVQGLAFCGGMLAVSLVTVIAGRVRRHDPVLVLVLSGVAMGALLGAGTSLLKIVADPYTQLPTMTYWLLGGLSAVTRADVLASVPAIVMGVVPLALLRWRINVLSLPDEEALALGMDVRRVRWVVVGAATLVTAAAVSISGTIGWVGLVVPHVARLLVGPDFRRLLPMALMLGAGFVVGADTVARTAARIEIPLGILTAIIGAPFLLWLLARSRRAW